MAGRLLSIEIGVRTTRVVEMDDREKASKIYQYFSLATPEGVMTDGSVAADPVFVEQLKAAISEKKVKARKAVFVMNSTRIANREVEIPLVKEKRIHDLLITNSAEFFPVDLMQYQLVHRIIEKNETDHTCKLSVLAVPKEIIASYEAFAEALGLEVAALDYMGNSIMQCMLHWLADPVKVAIEVDEDTSTLTILRGDKAELQRNIAYGISEAAETVMESDGYGKVTDFAEALELLRQQPCLFEWLDEKAEEGAEAAGALCAGVTESVRALVGNISRILDYYMSRNQDVTIEKVWLIGPGADVKGLDALLAHELGTPVDVLTTLPEMITNREIAEQGFRITEYLTAVAATLAPLALIQEEKGKKRTVASDDMRMPQLVCTAGLLLTVILVAAALIPSLVLQGQNRKLTEQVESLAEAAEVYDRYKAGEQKFSNVENMYALTETPDDALLSFLTEMEEKMPSDIVVVTMTAGTDGIQMSMTASSKDSAAKALMQLRDFPMISGVSSSEIVETKVEEGVSVVTFSVNCVYASADVGGVEHENEQE